MIERSYIRVRWLHALPNEPVELWSELNSDREEVRKIEIWADGRIGFASAQRADGGTRLSESPIPSVEEIAADPQFETEVISRSAFEDRWEASVP